MTRSFWWPQWAISFLLLAIVGLMPYFGLPSPAVLGVQGSFGTAFLISSFLCFSYWFPRKLGTVFVVFLLAAVLLLTFANWWHYQFFQSYFNYEFLVFARDSDGAMHSLFQFAYWPQIGLQALLFFVVIVIYGIWHGGGGASWHVLAQALGCLFLGTFFLSLSASQIDRLRQANSLTLSPYYFHPVQAFFTPLAGDTQGSEAHWRSFKYRNRVTERAELLPAGVVARPYNVIVLNLESFRASFVGAYGNRKQLTPEFDAMAQNGVLFENFYANSNYTVKSENAIICGFFDHNVRLSIAEYQGKKNLNCLPQLLKSSGYRSFYLHANRGKFYNRENYFPELAFDELYFHADHVPKKDDGRTYLGWGLTDEEFFSLALQRLTEHGDTPFYAQLMSISSHYPFQYDWPIPVPNDVAGLTGEKATYAGYENAIRYADHALGAFWTSFLGSALAENTILVVTGDHGVWSFDPSVEGSELQQTEEYFRVPLFIYHPAINGAYRIQQVGSHVDILPTLLDLIGVGHPTEPLIGKNLFDRVEEPWAVMMKGGEVNVRFADKLCMPKVVTCGGAYQNCWADTGVSDFVKNFGQGQCYQLHGDLLSGGAASSLTMDGDVLAPAIGMITFENSRVLGLRSKVKGERLGIVELDRALAE